MLNKNIYFNHTSPKTGKYLKNLKETKKKFQLLKKEVNNLKNPLLNSFEKSYPLDFTPKIITSPIDTITPLKALKNTTSHTGKCKFKPLTTTSLILKQSIPSVIKIIPKIFLLILFIQLIILIKMTYKLKFKYKRP